MIIPAKSQFNWLSGFYQICVFGADLKSNMAARVHNVFSLAEILKIFLSETTESGCILHTDGMRGGTLQQEN
jgi:hypothetical protein